MALTQFVASQFRQPSGWFGAILMGRVFNRVNDRINHLAIDRLQVQPDDHILDLGFGGGASLPRISARAVNGRTYGLDFSPVMVDLARHRFDHLIEAGRLEVGLGEAGDLPYADHTFTGIMTVNTIYFWDDPPAVLRELRRCLRDRARLIVAFRSRKKMERMNRWVADYRLYEPEEVGRLLERAGFRQVTLEHRDRDLKLDSVLAIGRK